MGKNTFRMKANDENIKLYETCRMKELWGFLLPSFRQTFLCLSEKLKRWILKVNLKWKCRVNKKCNKNNPKVLDDSHKYFSIFFMFRAFTVKYHLQTSRFFYDCHLFFYTWFTTSYFPHIFYDSTWCFSQHKYFHFPSFSVLRFCTINRVSAFLEMLTVWGRDKRSVEWLCGFQSSLISRLGLFVSCLCLHYETTERTEA